MAVIGFLHVAVAVASAAHADPPVEFLYADASEGGASGGHVALRLDDRVYHYQRDANGLLVLTRDSWRDFAFQYRVVENRNLFASEVDVSNGAAEQLRAHFDRRFVAEHAERMHRSALRDDVALLDALSNVEGMDAASRGESAGFALRGAGFFALGRKASGVSGRASRVAFAALREQIETSHGADFLATRWRDAREALRHATDPLEAEGSAASSLDAYPFSERYADAHAAELALDVLFEAPPLQRDVRRTLPGVLDASARASLRARKHAIETSLRELIASPRPDWGFAFLLGAARLSLTIESLERNRLVVLDVAPRTDAPRNAFAGHADALSAHLGWRRERLAAARKAFFADPSDERALSNLEREAALHAELVAAIAAGALPRPLAATLVPEARAHVHPLRHPGFDAETGATLRERAAQRLASLEGGLRLENDYDLIERNCATELFAQVEAAVDRATLPAVGAAPLTFVPFVADRAVTKHWPGARRRTLPSQRAAARATETSWLAGLRESNTLTSTLYVPHAGDSIFLFFTDDALVARPLLGAANVATGVVASGLGVFWAPLDHGTLLGRGLRGIAASLPELAFFNIRKGTFPLALPPRPAHVGADARTTR